MTTATITRHNGTFNQLSRQNRALSFIEAYVSNIASDLTLSYPDTKWYSPTCHFFDTTNTTYIGAKAIKTWMLELFSPFDRVGVESMSSQVVDESNTSNTSTGGKGALFTANSELMISYYPKGDPKPILAPRMFVFVIEDAVTEEGFEGLQFTDVKLYWDTDLVKSEMKRRAVAKA